MKEQRAAREGRHPEFDAIGIFHTILTQYATDFTRGLSPQKLEQLPRLLAETYRAASRFRLQPYPGVVDTIRQLHQNYHLAIVSDGQTAYAVPELNTVGLAGYFDPIIISGDVGVRKPHERLFTDALTAMKMTPSEVLFVGNDMYRDVYGAKRVGMTTVFCKSNQGLAEKEGVKPDYIIYQFPELLTAIRFFEAQ
jgi:putative hydrolase of the HAD superfamily